MRRAALPLLLAVTALALTGCGPQKNASYDDADELRKAVVSAGVECRNEEMTNGDAEFSDSTTVMCDQDLMLTVTDSEETGDELARVFRMLDSSFLRAANWVIATDDEYTLTTLQQELGGKIDRPA
jgi:hypothetical protein